MKIYQVCRGANPVRMAKVGKYGRPTVIIRRVRVDGWNKRHICRLRDNQIWVVGY